MNVPRALDLEEACQLWMDSREPLTAQEKREFVVAVRRGAIHSERRRLRKIAEALKACGKYEEACDFLLRLTGEVRLREEYGV